ncbi:MULTISPECIES: hypothetical protein [unclassified Rhodococcus (in: high G+C Gram-positive bacteria)]|uniref:hypothetical protein n=1 Tax=unclassified Rhodococcus (in: high G+C Gram-positive bacteria) TaxID=192944 RepID=UPI0015961658|nr:MULTISPECIES: hypothetical protein [unclassified Rhodococcus (in: high G+C Gram-positive bacteria)]
MKWSSYRRGDEFDEGNRGIGVSIVYEKGLHLSLNIDMWRWFYSIGWEATT